MELILARGRRPVRRRGVRRRPPRPRRARAGSASRGSTSRPGASSRSSSASGCSTTRTSTRTPRRATVGREDFRAAGYAAQARSVTVLTNDGGQGRPLLPLAAGLRIYAENVSADAVRRHGIPGRAARGRRRRARPAHGALRAALRPVPRVVVPPGVAGLPARASSCGCSGSRQRARSSSTSCWTVRRCSRPLLPVAGAIVGSYGSSDDALLDALTGAHPAPRPAAVRPAAVDGAGARPTPRTCRATTTRCSGSATASPSEQPPPRRRGHEQARRSRRTRHRSGERHRQGHRAATRQRGRRGAHHGHPGGGRRGDRPGDHRRGRHGRLLPARRDERGRLGGRDGEGGRAVRRSGHPRQQRRHGRHQDDRGDDPGRVGPDHRDRPDRASSSA